MEGSSSAGRWEQGPEGNNTVQHRTDHFGGGFVLRRFPEFDTQNYFSMQIILKQVLEVFKGCTLASKVFLPQVQLIYVGLAKWLPLTIASMIGASNSSQSFTQKGLNTESLFSPCILL